MKKILKIKKIGTRIKKRGKLFDGKTERAKRTRKMDWMKDGADGGGEKEIN